MKIKKQISLILLILGISILTMGCTATDAINSKSFDISVNSIEGNTSKHAVVLNFGKTKNDLKYFLYQNGEEIANGNMGIKGGEKEYIIDNGNNTKFEYKIKVISGDEELIKEFIYDSSETTNSSEADEEKVNDNEEEKNNTENEEIKQEDENKETNTSNNTNNDVQNWSAESKEYKTGDKVIYDGVTYECLNDHTSQEAWSPKNASSLWLKLD